MIAAEGGVKLETMAGVWISLVCLSLITNALAIYDSYYCKIFKTSDGLIPPPLPENFEMKGEHIDHTSNTTTYIEIYFDYHNSRGKFMHLLNGIEHHHLLDYHTQQVVTWEVVHPGMDFKRDAISHICSAVDLETSKDKNIFGYKLNDEMVPKMYTSNQALRYGGKYLYAANSTYRLPDRGLFTDKFVGCVYDSELDATFLSTFYFTEKNVIPSAGSESKVVTGEESGYLPVPVKMEIHGYVNENKDAGIFVNKSLNINWFNAEPKFRVGTFQLPPYVYCKDYRGRQEKPAFPKAFSTRLVITEMEVNVLGNMEVQESSSYEEIYYYAEKNLARRDFTPNEYEDSEIYSKFQSLDPVRTIHDFNEGVLYTIHKASGQCYIRAMLKKDYFTKKEKSLYTIIAPPEELFKMQTDKVQYKGKDYARDIECDVWTGKYYDSEKNATFVKESYMTTNGWHEEADEMIEYRAPIKHVVMKKEWDLSESASAYHFLKFEGKSPMLRSFDIRNCLESIVHKELAILLEVDDKTRKILYDYKYPFYDTAQYYLTKITEVGTPLRIQRLHLRDLMKKSIQTFLVFTIADKADLDSSVPVGQKGASLQEAIDKLQNFTDQNQFYLQFYPPSKKEPVIVEALSGGLYQVTSTGVLSFDPRTLKPTERPMATEKLKVFHSDDDDDDDEEDVETIEGMKTGSLVFLSFAMLFIGIGIGIAVMYLYVRYRRERIDDSIALHQKMSELEAKNEE